VRLESPIIFREAMLHVVGKFDLVTHGDFKNVNKLFLSEQENGRCILELAALKAKEIKDKKLLIERALLDFYPKKMIHSERESSVPGRQVYATDIYLWQALCLVRQYLFSCIQGQMHHRNPDGGVNFYRSIGAGGEVYLRTDTLVRFHETFGMSTKGKQCFQAAVEYIKEALRPIVADLLVDRTQTSKDGDARIPYLTCCEILDEELPWVVRRALQKKDEDNRDADGDSQMRGGKF